MAKSKWNKNLAHRIHDLANTPRDVWKAVTTLKEWIQGHHKSPDIILKNRKRVFFLKLMKKMWSYYRFISKNFNSRVNIDWEVLNDWRQKPVNNNINSPLSWKKLLIAINKLTLHKAPGLNDISPNTIKAWNDENMRVLFQIYSSYFNDDLYIEEWKIW